MDFVWTTMASPVGELRIVAADGAISALHFVDAGAPSTDDVAARYLARAESRDSGERDNTDGLLQDAVAQLAAYFDRSLKDFDLPLGPVGTPFQLKVWEQLRSIPYGETTTYGELAGRLGKTGHGARAVGLANGRNPIAIVVPCHRVVGAGGKLIGYGGGLDRKQQLLALEQAALF
jgi:methylated-DNA-[protein]-cysteine S-methyltransferase